MSLTHRQAIHIYCVFADFTIANNISVFDTDFNKLCIESLLCIMSENIGFILCLFGFFEHSMSNHLILSIKSIVEIKTVHIFF